MQESGETAGHVYDRSGEGILNIVPSLPPSLTPAALVSGDSQNGAVFLHQLVGNCFLKFRRHLVSLKKI